MAKQWELTDEVEKKYTSVVQGFIDRLEAIHPEEAGELLEMDFTGTELNPFTLGVLLEGLGYEETNRGDNGWELDYWITMEKEGFKPLSINGTAIVFELKLSEKSLEN